jgi:hypothetical protein
MVMVVSFVYSHINESTGDLQPLRIRKNGCSAPKVSATHRLDIAQ